MKSRETDRTDTKRPTLTPERVGRSPHVQARLTAAQEAKLQAVMRRLRIGRSEALRWIIDRSEPLR